MENQTCFNLDRALVDWRKTLASQPGVSTDRVREMESHLRDAMADLRQRGLSEEESFLIAARRLGSPTALAQEINKADPRRLWTERMFWLVVGLIVVRFYFYVAGLITFALFPPKTTATLQSIAWVPTAVGLGMLVLFCARGRFPIWLVKVVGVMSRPILLATLVILIAVGGTWAQWIQIGAMSKGAALGLNRPDFRLVASLLGSLAWSGVMACLVVLLGKQLGRLKSAE